MIEKTLKSILISFAVLLVQGCGSESGPPLAPANGSVNYKGQPVKSASVTFVYSDGQMAVGMTDDSGKFKLTTGAREGAPIGEASVVVSKSASMGSAGASPQMTPNDMMKMAQSKGKDMKAEAMKKGEIPAKYSKKETSGLKKTVVAGQSNDIAIDLVD